MIAGLLLSSILLSPAADTTAVDHALRDLRVITTAIEAYAVDNGDFYAPADGLREGDAADLDAELGPIYRGMAPKVDPVPHVDPWGHPYRFVISDSRRLYAFYSFGVAGKLEPRADAFLRRLRQDKVDEGELTIERASENIVFAGGMLVFTPRKSARDGAPYIVNRERDTPEHISESDIELIAIAIETYLRTHDALPQSTHGKNVRADAVLPVLTSPVPEAPLAAIDPWKRPYEIAVSPTGRRAAVYTRGERNAISDDAEPLVRKLLRGEMTSPATMYGVNIIVTSLVARETK